jgi:hypothetical protein
VERWHWAASSCDGVEIQLGGIINVSETPLLLGFLYLLVVWLVARDL